MGRRREIDVVIINASLVFLLTAVLVGKTQSYMSTPRAEQTTRSTANLKKKKKKFS